MWTILTSVYTPRGWRFRTWRIAADERVAAVAHTRGIVVSAKYERSQQYREFADGLDVSVARAA
jgi:hypothetical protein